MKHLILITISLAVFCFVSPILVRAEDQVKTLNSEITRLAKQYVVNEKKARAIMMCESELKPYALNLNKNKNGEVWSRDLGLWQINDYFHKETMEKMDLDINDQWDNLEYGFILLDKQGDKPWSASSKCWKPSLTKELARV